MEAAWADLQALAAGEAGTLRVGTYQSVGARILPDLMRRFVAERPGVEVHLTESTSDQELLDQVERGRDRPDLHGAAARRRARSRPSS